MQVQIRNVQEADAADVTDLSAQLGYSTTVNETLSYIKEINSNKNEAVFVAVLENKVVGWIHVFSTTRLESGIFSEIGGLVVDEKYRGKGIGKALIAEAKNWAKGKDIAVIRVRCNTKRKDAHSVYLNLGFAESKEQKVFQLNLNQE